MFGSRKREDQLLALAEDLSLRLDVALGTIGLLTTVLSPKQRNEFIRNLEGSAAGSDPATDPRGARNDAVESVLHVARIAQKYHP
jgi:hypothetical protein